MPYSRIFSRILVVALLVFPGLSPAFEMQPAPDFSLPTSAETINLEAYRGKVVYLDFWASWCAPCVKSFPWMNEMQERYKDEGLVVLAVNLDKDEQEVGQFLEKYPASFTVAFDPEGAIAERYRLKGMPSSYLIDQEGNIVASHIGFRSDDPAELESSIKSLLIR